MVYSTKCCCSSQLWMRQTWIRVSTVERVNDGQSHAMFLRWKNAVRVICLVCDSNERVELKGILGLHLSVDGVNVDLSKLRQKF